MSFGLREQDVSYIQATIKKFPQIKKALIFGSRAKGNYKNGSDIDIAIIGEDVTFDVVAKLRSLLEDESPMPYMFDIIDYTHLKHIELKDHIDRIGKLIYEK